MIHDTIHQKHEFINKLSNQIFHLLQYKVNLVMHLCVVLFLVCYVSANANVCLKITFMCPRSIAGVPFDLVRRYRASLLLYTTCMHLCCNWVASCQAVWWHYKPKIKNQVSFISLFLSSC